MPLYTGKPAPVIFTPSSKSIKSYFFANSQCGKAPSTSFGISPSLKISSLSFSSVPAGTKSFGILGIVKRSFCNFSRVLFKVSLSSFDSSFNCDVFSFKRVAFCASPFLYSRPISLENELDCARVSSSLACVAFRNSSVCKTSLKIIDASKPLFESAWMNFSLFSRISFTCNIYRINLACNLAKMILLFKIFIAYLRW